MIVNKRNYNYHHKTILLSPITRPISQKRGWQIIPTSSTAEVLIFARNEKIVTPYLIEFLPIKALCSAVIAVLLRLIFLFFNQKLIKVC
jgi:hypothetical protein